MSDTTPEVLVDETVALLREHPDLSSRFHIRAADGESSPVEVLVDTKASAKKGEIVVIPEREIPEELGVLEGGSAYVYTLPVRIVMVDRRNATLSRQAMRAITQTLRGVALPSASGAIEFTESWARVDDLGADNVRAWDTGFEVDYNDVLETIGYGTPSPEDTAGSNVTPEVLVDETVALLREHSDLARFHIRAADGESSLPEVVATTMASATKGEIVVFAERESAEELDVLAGGTAYLYTVPIRVAILDGRTPALARTARTAIKQTLRNALLPSASGRIAFTESWARADELEQDTLRVWDIGFEVDYDDILETIGYVAPASDYGQLVVLGVL